jgi:hypothetical protein
MKISDEELVAAIKGDLLLSREQTDSVLDELLRARRLFRADSRRAEQVRRVRWAVENLLVKVERMGDRVMDEPLLESEAV